MNRNFAWEFNCLVCLDHCTAAEREFTLIFSSLSSFKSLRVSLTTGRSTCDARPCLIYSSFASESKWHSPAARLTPNRFDAISTERCACTRSLPSGRTCVHWSWSSYNSVSRLCSCGCFARAFIWTMSWLWASSRTILKPTTSTFSDGVTSSMWTRSGLIVFRFSLPGLPFCITLSWTIIMFIKERSRK